MRLPPPWVQQLVRYGIGAVAVLLPLWSMKGCYDRQQRDLGALQVRDSIHVAQIAALQLERHGYIRTIDSIHRWSDSALRVERLQRAQLNVRLTGWEQLLASLAHPDSSGSAPAPTLRDIVLVADTTIKSCVRALTTCEQVHAADSAELAIAKRLRAVDSASVRVITADRDLWKHAARPSYALQLSRGSPWLATGAAAGILLCKYLLCPKVKS